jgi:hypothetical protein
MAEDEDREPLNIEYDTLIAAITARNKEDGERASSAGESRQKIGEFLETTGMNGQAFSWCRSILKKKKYSQQMDVLISLEEALPMIRAAVMGGQTEMVLDAAPEEAPKAETKVVPIKKTKAKLPADVQADSDDFEAHLAKVQEAAE